MSTLPSLSKLISSETAKPLVISHRGAWTEAPENSIQAMELAADAGADMVELDVQRTTAGHLFMMHDDTLDRMTNLSGPSTDVTDDTFETMFLRQGAGGTDALVTHHQVPSLHQTLEAARGRVHLNIDTKHRRDLDAVGNLVCSMGMEDQVLIKMLVNPAQPDASIKKSRWFKDLSFMPVVLNPRSGRMAQDALTVAHFYDAQMLEISFLSLSELDETSIALHAEGVRLWCNTLDSVHPLDFHDTGALSDPDAVWGTLIRHGIGAIQTDHTAALSLFLRAK
ncbi:MAG: glycerophosphodiester phosphodiesterase family protein [Roseobacter sp.]